MKEGFTIVNDGEIFPIAVRPQIWRRTQLPLRTQVAQPFVALYETVMELPAFHAPILTVVGRAMPPAAVKLTHMFTGSQKSAEGAIGNPGSKAAIAGSIFTGIRARLPNL